LCGYVVCVWIGLKMSENIRFGILKNGLMWTSQGSFYTRFRSTYVLRRILCFQLLPLPTARPVRNSYPFNQNASLYRTAVLLTVSLAFVFRTERYLSLPPVINLHRRPTYNREKNEHNVHIICGRHTTKKKWTHTKTSEGYV